METTIHEFDSKPVRWIHHSIIGASELLRQLLIVRMGDSMASEVFREHETLVACRTAERLLLVCCMDVSLVFAKLARDIELLSAFGHTADIPMFDAYSATT